MKGFSLSNSRMLGVAACRQGQPRFWQPCRIRLLRVWIRAEPPGDHHGSGRCV